MKAVVAAFNQEKALVGAFSVITNLRMELFWGTTVSIQLAVAVTDMQMMLDDLQNEKTFIDNLFTTNN